MKHSMRSRLLIFFALLSLVLVISIVWMTRVAFQTGFVSYLNSQTNQRLEELSQVFADHYKLAGGWALLEGNPRMWRDLVEGGRDSSGFDPLDLLKREQFNPLDYRAGPYGFEPPAEQPAMLDISIGLRNTDLTLLDTEGRWIGGRRLSPEDRDLTSIPVQVNGISVGYLTTLPVQDIRADLDLNFAQEQLRISIWIALVTLAITLIAAWLIAERLLAPIRSLSRGVGNLISGNFRSQIEIESDDELGQLARDFNKLSNTLNANRTAQQRWISDISHELRTPVAILEGEIQAILDGIRQPNEREMQSLAAEIKRLGRLIGDLHQLSKSDSGDLSYRMSPLYIKDVLEQVTQTFNGRIQESGLTCKLNLENKQAMVLADESRLIQLFSNLLENSCRYTDSPGKILIETKQQGNDLLISVSDSAPGVEPKDMPLLFDRLYRVEQSRNRSTGGSGLGLAICRNIAIAHEAQLEATDSSLGGLKMTLKIPLYQNEKGAKL